MWCPGWRCGGEPPPGGMSSVTTMISRPGSSAIASFNSGVTLVAGVCCCEMAGTSAPAPSITISATANWSVRPGAPMVASSQVLRSARRGCQIRSGRSKLAGRRRRLHRAPSDDGFDLGYIAYLLVDYEVKVRYRFAMLRILREQSCNDGGDAQGAHEPQGQVASIPCSRPVSPCSCRQAGCSDRRRMRAFPVFFLKLTGSHRRQVVPGVLFLPCYLQEESGGTRYSSSSRNGSAS